MGNIILKTSSEILSASSTAAPLINDFPEWSSYLDPDRRRYSDLFTQISGTPNLSGLAVPTAPSATVWAAGTTDNGVITKPVGHPGYVVAATTTGQCRASIVTDFNDGEIGIEFLDTATLGSIGIIARYNATIGCYYGFVNAAGQVTLQIRGPNNVNQQLGTPTATPASSVTVTRGAGLIHSLRMKVLGLSLKLWCDGQLCYDYTVDSAQAYASNVAHGFVMINTTDQVINFNAG